MYYIMKHKLNVFVFKFKFFVPKTINRLLRDGGNDVDSLFHFKPKSNPT